MSGVLSEWVTKGDSKVLVVGKLVFIAALVIGLAAGSWFVKREFNYSLNYESQVQETFDEDIKPFKKRIELLEKRVEELSEKLEKQ